MGTRALRFFCLCFIATISVVLLGCGSGNSHSVCGTCCAACPADFTPLLYATTSSNQILGFTIDRNSGALTAIPAATGPANSQSIAAESNSLVFADTSTNSVDSVGVNLVSGAFMAIQGSPFSLGTSNGGPTGIAVGPFGYLYATEPNGTIVGLGAGSELGSFATPLPGSPYSAGVAPAQITFGAGSNNTNFLYASDPGDATGGILAYSLDSTGALTPINGSPFPTLAGANPSFVLSGNYMASQGVQGAGFLFVSLTGAAKVAVFAIDSNTGDLTAVPGSPFLVGNGPSTLVEDEFNHLFVMNAADHTVSAFNLASNGVLTAIGTPMLVGTASGGMAYFPESQLYVADPAGNEIWTLNVDHTTGVLTEPGPPLLVVPNSPLQLSVFTL
jgi:6-phosphogluconolactonase